MAVESGYPVVLVHPGHRAAKSVQGNEPAVLELFPSVTVNGADSEAQYRAQGYLRYGEPPPAIDYHEYPKMLRHPGYKEAIPERTEARMENGKIIGTFSIPGVPAEMPDVIVQNVDQEELWRDKGYRPAGEYDREALDSVLSGAADEIDYDPREWPKWVDGVLVERDPEAPPVVMPTPAYPRWENGAIVQDPRFDPEPDPREYPKWIHVDGIPGESSVLVKNPREEFEVRRQLKEAQAKCGEVEQREIEKAGSKNRTSKDAAH